MSHVSAGDTRNKIQKLYFVQKCNDLSLFVSLFSEPNHGQESKLAGQFCDRNTISRMASTGKITSLDRSRPRCPRDRRGSNLAAAPAPTM